MARKFALAAAPQKVNPRISVRVGWRCVGLLIPVLKREAFEKVVPDILDIIKEEGPVSNLAKAHRALGEKAFAQSNFAEFISLKALGKRINPKVEKAFNEVLKTLKKQPSKDFSYAKVKPRLFKTTLNIQFNPTHSSPSIYLFDIIDKDSKYIIFELVTVKPSLLKQGTALLEKVKIKRSAFTRQLTGTNPSGRTHIFGGPKSKLQTYKGVKGYWITTNTGRHVFIPQDKLLGYRAWSGVSSAVDLASIATGMGLTLGGINLAAQAATDKSLKKAAGLSLPDKMIKKLTTDPGFRKGAIAGLAILGALFVAKLLSERQRKKKVFYEI